MTDRTCLPNAKWDLIPEHTRGSVERYIEHGIHPGSFLTAVICNDLRGAMDHADDTNRARLSDIVSFFYYYAPNACWGSPAKMQAWGGCYLSKAMGVETMTELKFINSDATPKTVILSVTRKSISLVMAWYGSHFAGDRYSVFVDGVKAVKDRNGELVGPLPCKAT